MDTQFMKRAIELSKKGYGHVNPNPIVGAVIVKDGIIVGEGYHEKYGKYHAERNAIKNAKDNSNSHMLKGATMYVTLEPCCHYGKTPPCTEAIMENGISEVYVGCLDPHDKVSGKGVDILRKHGIKVHVGMMEEEIRKSNEIFLRYIKNKEVFVIMKSGSSLDGKISTCTGESKWITCEESRHHAHTIRNRVMAIMVGVNTVIEDDPSLTVRNISENPCDPVKVIVDTNGRTPLDCKLLIDSGDKVILGVGECIESEKIEKYKQMGATVIKTPLYKGKVDLKFLINKLGEMGIDSLLIEGGGNIHFSAFEQGVVNKIMMYFAPKIIGGASSKTSVEGNGFEKLIETTELEDINIVKIGTDFLVEGYVKK
ncbi:bifunctional diaminohydroxyphosphoribosylaminopyrimidine deaminase/5-amino-6-(5-phosphoribosylamino)uracil reductase RibD [Oceanirhabdus sp. W0125-5]|uniref:bifunctional diaminohydroxyphosphoribosylaminopyrimidine deaminase/5-amino-6-(5-phosphoribosylamino)uracil reductase RibD n=1 Tax=Oceanirhabdus sp. W0125-5 TaxID=2999116 RepID=UPI0022F30559|nr:bifunctional diaminohydroxyphosphoribosylaminopyrimidine deaminase/5-amino-6-(5-phosphoribosylamino)uracil reductase RibD [Oceanirhabdus sp. W0125-5]WBW95965.1 bifunctional diaminohydroxyphosphoribosylaminopyrimidine deaminase/5-amino-6-(5-phosphoribosylamino)uracil reductase RibD [Oceanirhabdus sp. W0125-5]